VTTAGSPRLLLLLRIALSLLALAAVGLVAIKPIAEGNLGSAASWADLVAPAHLLGSLTVVAAVAVSIIIRGLRWTALMAEAAPAPPARMVAGFGWSFLVLQALPFRAGEAYRIAWVKLRGGSAIYAISSIVVERVLDALLLLGMLALVALAQPGLAGGFDAFAMALLTAAGVALFAVAVTAGRLRAFAQRYVPPGRMGELVQSVFQGLGAISGSKRGLIVLLLTLAAWGVHGSVFSMFLAARHDVPWSTGLAVLALTNLSGVVTVSPGHLGVFEAVAVLVLAGAGVPADTALVSAIALHMAVLFGQALTGLGCRLFLLIRER
jgi:uncharacterized membrane protein YbhN (UPF0104 family)